MWTSLECATSLAGRCGRGIQHPARISKKGSIAARGAAPELVTAVTMLSSGARNTVFVAWQSDFEEDPALQVAQAPLARGRGSPQSRVGRHSRISIAQQRLCARVSFPLTLTLPSACNWRVGSAKPCAKNNNDCAARSMKTSVCICVRECMH